MERVNQIDSQQGFLSDEFVIEAPVKVIDFKPLHKNNLKTDGPAPVGYRSASRTFSARLQTVENLAWHRVADILDRAAITWAHSIKDIRTIGDFVIVTAAITIDGVTREGIGTGSARNEAGMRKAEHDALKRAAEKFGIVRDVYKRELDAHEKLPQSQIKYEQPYPQSEPIARTISELITPRQISMIRYIARKAGADADTECTKMFGCSITDLSRWAASKLIEYLKEVKTLQASTRSAS